MTVPAEAAALQEQLDYYRARAAEYDQWWLRQGRYDRGEALNRQWFVEVEQLYQAVSNLGPAGRILELACGTGIWTERLVRESTELTAVDGSPEMLALNAGRVRSPKLCYIEANLFEWKPVEQYDIVFFGFWLSHVPPERFAAFWQLVRSCLVPGGRVFFVDSRHEENSTAIDHRLPEPSVTALHRKLNDGREFRIYKIFYDPAELAERLRGLGWRFEVQETDHYFLYGSGRLESDGG